MFDLDQLLTGANVRALAGIVDVGQVLLGYVADIDGGAPSSIASDASDIYIKAIDTMFGQAFQCRLFTPMNAFFRLPSLNESCLILKPAEAHGPGTPYVLYGDCGAAKQIPAWLSAALSGISVPEALRIESQKSSLTLGDGSGGTAGLDGTGNFFVQHFFSRQSTSALGVTGPPTSSDPSHLAIDPTSTDEEGAFTLSLSASPPTDKSIGITVSYNRPYQVGSRVWLQAASDDAAKLVAAGNPGGAGADSVITEVYVSASDKNGFTVQNRTGAGSTGPAITGTWNYRVTGK